MSTKKIKNGTHVTWAAKTRWGLTRKTGTVIRFVPRFASVRLLLTARKQKAFKGADTNSINHRYLVEDADGRITAPRAPALERAFT